MEYELDQHKEAMKRGADHFSRIEEKIKPLGIKFWLPVILTLLALGSGWAYTVIKKPDAVEVKELIEERSPYNKDQYRVRSMLDNYDDDRKEASKALQDIKVEQAIIHGKLDTISVKLGIPAPPRRDHD